MTALAGLASGSSSLAQDGGDARTDTLKAAYLFNFVKFVESPTNAQSETLTMCFVDAPRVQETLQSSPNARQLGARPVTVRTLRAGDSPQGCEVVYFSSTAARENQALLQQARSVALTVSDADDFTSRGGVIQLFTAGNRLRFVINTENAKQAQLRISSNLLKLASHVEQSGE